jgi:hypothetical protein
MSVDAHLAELQRRHQTLERKIQTEAAHSSVDEVKLTELKRKKLSLKDEIEKLKNASHSQALH